MDTECDAHSWMTPLLPYTPKHKTPIFPFFSFNILPTQYVQHEQGPLNLKSTIFQTKTYWDFRPKSVKWEASSESKSGKMRIMQLAPRLQTSAWGRVNDVDRKQIIFAKESSILRR